MLVCKRCRQRWNESHVCAEPKTVTCPQCTGVFSYRGRKRTYCDACRAARLEARRPRDKWMRRYSVVKLPKSLKRPAQRASTSTTPYGKYVYAWFDKRQVLPFYIGSGIERRAWDKHTQDGEITYAQVIRESLGDHFEVRVLRQNLTTKGALLVESVLIDFVRGCGGELLNIQRGLKKPVNESVVLDERLEQQVNALLDLIRDIQIIQQGLD